MGGRSGFISSQLGYRQALPAPQHDAGQEALRDVFGGSPWIWKFMVRLSGLPQLFSAPRQQISG